MRERVGAALRGRNPRVMSLTRNSGSVATAMMAPLTMNGGQPSMPVIDSSNGPTPMPADSAAA